MIIHKAKYLFIDTEVFVRKKMNLSNYFFANIPALVQEKNISVLSTFITIREIKNHFIELAENFSNEAKKISKNKQAFNNSDISVSLDILSNISRLEIETSLLAGFNEFTKQCKMEVISIPDGIINHVFSNYFDLKPPFSMGKKKSEFPDAFVISTLEQKSEQLHEPIIVISGDPDWKEACENNNHFHFYNEIENFYKMLTQEDKQKYAIFMGIYNKYKNNAKKLLEELFLNCGFYLVNNSFRSIVEDTIDDVSVDDIQLDDEPIVIEEYETGLLFICNVHIDYTCTAYFDDVTNAVYDKEDGKYYFEEPTSEVINGSITKLVNIDISYRKDDPNYELLNYVVFVDSDDIDVELKDEDFPYK